MSEKKTIVIFGNNISALIAAIRFAEQGQPVFLFSEHPPRQTFQTLLTEGFAVYPNEKHDEHFQASLQCAEFLVPQEPLKELCEAGPRFFSYLKRLGVIFDRTVEGAIAAPARSGKQTAFQILNALESQVLRFEAQGLIERKWGRVFVDLILEDGKHCRGLIFQDVQDLKFQTKKCDAVIFTEGYHFTKEKTGGTLARLYRKGVVLANLEFFHPEGNDFTFCLGGSWTDESHQTALCGVFSCGEADFHYLGARALPGNFLLSLLYSGYRCANAVFQNRQNQNKDFFEENFLTAKQAQEKEWETILDMSGPENVYRLSDELSEMMRTHVGPRRNKKNLETALIHIERFKQRFQKIGLNDRSLWQNPETLFVRTLKDRILISELITRAALLREESRGTHEREDFPEKNEERFLKITKMHHTPNGPEIFYENVEQDDRNFVFQKRPHTIYGVA